MEKVLKQDTLEVPTEIDFVVTAKTIDSKMLRIRLISKKENEIVMDSRCRHTGGHGSRYHQGNGYCHWCTICNPSNPKAY